MESALLLLAMRNRTPNAEPAESDSSGDDSDSVVDGEAEQQAEQEQKGKSRKGGIKWGPLLMMIFMFGSSIGGGVLFLMEKFAGPSSHSPNGGGYHGFYWCQDQVEALYRTHNPAKVPEAASLCTKYEGREKKLVNKIRRKYR